MIPAQEAFYLEEGPYRLLSVWQGVEGTPRMGVLFCHPLGEEKKCAHRAFVETARALAGHGVASLRFDMRGCGDSEGEFEDARFADWIEDIGMAWGELQRRAPDCPHVILGLRVGASLAAMACEKLEGVSGLILWQPVIDGEREFSSELRRLLIQRMMTEGKAGASRRDVMAAFERGEGEIELDGYLISPALYHDICSIDLPAQAGNLPERTAVIRFARRSAAVEFFGESHGRFKALDVPPLWVRSDFIPNVETGETLAQSGVIEMFNES